MPSQQRITARNRLKRLKGMERQLIAIQAQYRKETDYDKRLELQGKYQALHAQWLMLKFPAMRNV